MMVRYVREAMEPASLGLENLSGWTLDTLLCLSEGRSDASKHGATWKMGCSLPAFPPK